LFLAKTFCQRLLDTFQGEGIVWDSSNTGMVPALPGNRGLQGAVLLFWLPFLGEESSHICTCRLSFQFVARPPTLKYMPREPQNGFPGGFSGGTTPGVRRATEPDSTFSPMDFAFAPFFVRRFEFERSF
jgi:hypothetical protein